MERARESNFVRFSIGLYRLLLSTYPSAFRREYGQPMAQVFLDCCREAIQSGGPPALLVLWARTMLDYLKSVIEEYANRGVDMTRDKFVRLSGWALIIGPLSLFIGMLASNRPEYNPNSALSLPIDRYINMSSWVLIIGGLILTTVGLIGLQLRFGDRAGAFGRISLTIGAVAGGVSTLGAIGLDILDNSISWTAFFLGITVMFLGLGLFGISCLQRKLLKSGNWLPLAALLLPAYVLIGGIYESISGNWIDFGEIFAAIFLLTTAALIPLAQGLIQTSGDLQPPETFQPG